MALVPNSKPAKSLPESIPISSTTQAIIKRHTGKYYEMSHELPYELNLSWYRDLVDAL